MLLKYRQSDDSKYIDGQIADPIKSQQLFKNYEMRGLNSLWRDFPTPQLRTKDEVESFQKIFLKRLHRAYEVGDVTMDEVNDALRIFKGRFGRSGFNCSIEAFNEMDDVGDMVQLDGVAWFIFPVQKCDIFDDDGENVVPEKLANVIIQDYPVAYIGSGQLAVWNKQQWNVNHGESTLEHVAQTICNDVGAENYQNIITQAMLAIQRKMFDGVPTAVFEEQDEENTAKVQFKNGTLNTAKWSFTRLNPLDHIVNKTNYNYHLRLMKRRNAPQM